MSMEQKRLLGKNIMSLEQKDLRGVYDIVRENMKMDGKTVEFDLEKLPSRVLFELDRYVKQKLNI